MKILTLEASRFAVSSLQFNCAARVHEAEDFEDVISLLGAGYEYDCFIGRATDVLPEAVRLLRTRKHTVPVIVTLPTNLTKDDVDARVTYLKNGADHVIMEPYDTQELCAYVRAVVRRNSRHKLDVIENGELRIDVTNDLVYIGEDPVKLNGHACTILHELAKNVGTIVSKERLIDVMYGDDECANTHILSVYMSRIRRVLREGGIPATTHYPIENHWGRGYRMVEMSNGR